MRVALLAAGLVFGVTEIFAVFSTPIWYTLAGSPTESTLSLITTSTSGIGILVDPIVVFLVMFVLGRNLDLPSAYASAFLTVFAGVAIGTIASVLPLAVLFAAYVRQIDLFTYMLEIMIFSSVGALRLSFVAFAGLAPSYLSRSHPPERIPT